MTLLFVTNFATPLSGNEVL